MSAASMSEGFFVWRECSRENPYVSFEFLSKMVKADKKGLIWGEMNDSGVIFN